ncbi:MAG: zinc ribbon domain-containing protein [Thermoanaerobaculia bacterium]
MSASATVAAPAKVRKFPCPSCGADVVWSPGAARLQCPYCGAEQEIPTSSAAVAERPLEAALAAALAAPAAVGWGSARRTVRCPRCGAVESLDANVAASRCSFCGTPGVVEAEASSTMARPQGLVPFRVDRDRAATTFRGWLSGLWLRPSDLKIRARLATIEGVYIPFWTFDAATHSSWTAEAGYHYTVRSGNRTETRTRWEKASGFLEYFIDDLPVPSSHGLEPELVRKIEPFGTGKLVDYAPEFLSGFHAEENAVSLPDAFALAKVRMQQIVFAECGKAVPGDTHRNLRVDTRYSGLAFKNALLPIWIAAYDYKGEIFRFLINGETGKVAGRAPWSWIKITLLVLGLATAFLLFQWLTN